jgi:hypothetical protein
LKFFYPLAERPATGVANSARMMTREATCLGAAEILLMGV